MIRPSSAKGGPIVLFLLLGLALGHASTDAKDAVRVFTLFLHILLALNKKAAGAYGGVVDFVACAWLHELHEQTDNFTGGV